MSIPAYAEVYLYVQCPYCSNLFQIETNFNAITESEYIECKYCDQILLIEKPVP